jgi:hypothetical protein
VDEDLNCPLDLDIEQIF